MTETRFPSPQIALLVLTLALLASGIAARPFQIALSAAKLEDYGEYTFSTERDLNRFRVSLSDLALLDDSDLWVKFESKNPDFSLVFTKDFTSKRRLLKVDAPSGNSLFVMAHSLYNGLFSFMRETSGFGVELFAGGGLGDRSTSYRLVFMITRQPKLLFNTRYYIYLDPMKKVMDLDLEYDGALDPQKLRFQIDVLRKKPDFYVNGRLDYIDRSYQLNNIFSNVVGGVLFGSDMQLCNTGTCAAKLSVISTKTKLIAIEARTSGKIEKVSPARTHGIYGRTSEGNMVCVYELPFEDRLLGKDVSVLLVPVLGTTELYANTKSLPLSIDGYGWKDVTHISKRLTIRRSVLNQMKSIGDPLFIAIKTSDPSEFYLRVEAHRPGSGGRLQPGITENVSMRKGERLSFSYVFETHETKNANFEVRMDKQQGAAKLYLLPCDEGAPCRLRRDTLNSPRAIAGTNTIGYSLINNNLPCEVAKGQPARRCKFLVVVEAKESCSFELSVNEREFHRLLIPGHTSDVNVFAGQLVYFKLSNPFSADLVSQIALAVSPHYGTFTVAVSRTQKFPNSENSSIVRSFKASRAQLDQLSQSLEISEANIDDSSIRGPLYIGVQATTTSSFSLKYVNPTGASFTVHALPEGVESKGQVSSPLEVSYHSIRLYKDPRGDAAADHIYLHLTPIQGNFQLFVNRGSRLPTLTKHQYFSEDNNIRLPIDGNETEYVVGVQARQMSWDSADSPQGGQFYLSFATTDTVMRLQSGSMFTKFVKARNTFAIEISHEMANLLVLKNSLGQDKATVCANFTSSESVSWPDSACQYTLAANQSALFFETDEIYNRCEAVKKLSKASHCYLTLLVAGPPDGHFAIGYTYNNHPFHLYDESTLTIPTPLRIDANINFVYHVKEHKKVHLQFHNRGTQTRVFTKLSLLSDIGESISVRFPNQEDHDAANQKAFGNQVDVLYDKPAIEALGKDAVLLISVRPAFGKTTGDFYVADSGLHLRVMSKLREVHRSHILKEHLMADQWTFFKLFVGPRIFKIRATVSSSSAVHIEARLAKGVSTEIDKSDARAAGFQFVELFVNDQDFELKDKKISGGYYTLAVKCAKNSHVSLFWNSEAEEDLAHLQANEPQSILLARDRPVNFAFFLLSQWTGTPGLMTNGTRQMGPLISSMNFYLQANKKIAVTLTTSDKEGRGAGKDEPASGMGVKEPGKWRTTVGENGGIASLKIGHKESGFCTGCYYLGHISADSETQVTISAQPLGPESSAITLVPGVTIPEELQPKESLRFQIYNADRDILDITVNLMAGFVDVYLGLDQQVSETAYAEKNELAATLQSQRLVIIAPFKYNIQGPHMFYLLVKNPYSNPCSFSLTADKNSLPTSIQHGVTKMVRLAQGEGTNFVYTPKDNDHVELVFELRQVFNPKYLDQALELIQEYLRVMHVDQQELTQYPADNLQKSSKGNKVYLSFDVPKAQLSHFLIHVYNPVNSGVIGSVNLLNKGYKLLTYNERFVDTLKTTDTIVYEAFGQPSQYLFVDLRLCVGDVRIDFYQTNFTNVDEDKGAEYQHLKDANNFIHYIKLQSNKVFLRIRNDQAERAVYQLNVFGENEIDANPFQKLVQGDGGKIRVEWDQRRVVFRPVNLSPQYKGRFWHKIEYTLYLTSDMRAMRYARNCGDFMLEKVLGEQTDLRIFASAFEFRGETATEPAGQVSIPFSNLTSSTKYYGVVVARVSLFPADEGILTPVRTETSYYDEFVTTAPHLAIPMEQIVTLLLTLAVVLLALYLGKKCLFSELSYRRYFQNPSDIFRSDEVQLNFSIDAILENYYTDDTLGDGEAGPEVELGQAGGPPL